MAIPKINLLSNFLGKGMGALASLLLIPYYVKFLGVENYGIIGFYSVLVSLSCLFDGGIGTTLNREMARSKASASENIKGIFRTYEIIYWAIAALIGVLIVILSSFISEHWISSESTSVNSIHQNVLLMAGAIFFQVAFCIYSSALMGLQRHDILNAIVVSMILAKGIGAILLLWLVAPSLELFFGWQILVNILQVSLASFFTWKLFPATAVRPKFDVKYFMQNWRFAKNMFLYNTSTIVLQNIDKIVVSSLVDLKMFGYYCLATALSNAISHFTIPLNTTVFPKFAELVVLGDEGALKTHYHHTCQFMTLLIAPICLVLAFFSSEIMWLWTHSPESVEHSAKILSILSLGFGISALLCLPISLQIAYGWVKPVVMQNMTGIVIGIPLMYLMTKHYGALGTAYVWLSLNLCFLLVMIQVFHKRILKQEKVNWYLFDISCPLLAALAVVSLGKQCIPSQLNDLQTIAALGGVFLMSITASIATTQMARSWLKKMYL